MIILKSERELQYLYDAGQVVAKTHQEVAKAVRPGVTTLELDRVAEEYILKCQAKPAFKGYHGFPGSICASINEEVVHGIPSSLRQVKSGDIISIDIGAVMNGYVGDAAEEHQMTNFGSPGRGPRLKASMALAIEPMVNVGTYQVETLGDDWTVVTKDRKQSAHFEHSIAITERGPWILTE